MTDAAIGSAISLKLSVHRFSPILSAVVLYLFLIVCSAIYWDGRSDLWLQIIGSALVVLGMTLAGVAWAYYWHKTSRLGILCAVLWFAVSGVWLLWDLISATDYATASQISAVFSFANLIVTLIFAIPALVFGLVGRAVLRRSKQPASETVGPPRISPRAVGIRVALIISLVMAGTIVPQFTKGSSPLDIVVFPIFLADMSLVEHRMVALEKHYKQAPEAEFVRIIEAAKEIPPDFGTKQGGLHYHLYHEIPPSLTFLKPIRVEGRYGSIEIVMEKMFDSEVTLSVIKGADSKWQVRGHFGDYMKPDEQLWPKQASK